MGRALRVADGPDEVRLRAVALRELKRDRTHIGAASAYPAPPLDYEGNAHG
jgi:hypothetical protein